MDAWEKPEESSRCPDRNRTLTPGAPRPQRTSPKPGPRPRPNRLGGRGSPLARVLAGFVLASLALCVFPGNAQAEGICDRTNRVQTAILAKISGVSDCADVTSAHLDAIVELDVSTPLSLQSGDFNGLSNLTRLDLSYGYLNDLPTDIFSPLGNLETLELTSNNLKPDALLYGSSNQDGVFDNLSKLKRLTLSANDLTYVNRHMFPPTLNKLESLFLNANNMTTVTGPLSLSSLETLHLRDNKITSLAPSVFASLSRLKYLRLDGNGITSMRNETLANLTGLVELGWSDNGIRRLDSHTFDGFFDLYDLNLSGNQLRSLPFGVFSDLTNLVILSLSGNQLSSLSGTVFSGLTKLRDLRLRGNNQLSLLSPYVFSDLTSLKDLYLDRTLLSSLPDRIFFGRSLLRTLWLSNNPGTPFTLTMEPEKTEVEGRVRGKFVVKVREAAPFAMTTNLSVTGGRLSATSVTVAAGSTTSNEITATLTPGSTDALVVTLGPTVTRPPSNYQGVRTAVGGPLTLITPPGVTVDPPTVNPAEGGSASYTVRLNTQPQDDVTIAVAHASGDPDLSVSAGASLTFTTTTWDMPQTVTIAADQDDDGVHGTATFTHTASSTDTDYPSTLTIASVTATEADDDPIGVTVDPLSVIPSEGASASYTVTLNTQPTADVTIAVARASGGDTDLTVNGGASLTLTFTTTNWSMAQTVTIDAAQDDDAVHGTATFTHTAASDTDTDYPNVTIADVTATEVDDEATGVTVSPPTVTASEGGSASYMVKLNTQPQGDVTIAVARASGGDTDLTVNGGASFTLTFTTTDWSTAQTVTIDAAQDDDAVHGTATFTHTAASDTDTDYPNVTIASVTATEADDDTVGVTVSPPTVTPAEGGSASYTVKLNTQPTADVTIAVARASGAEHDTDLTVNGGASLTLTFTTTNWSMAQTVTIDAAQDDDAVHGTATFTHTAASDTDTDYPNVTIADVTATEVDDDIVGVTVFPLTVTAAEGGSANYTVKLNTQPKADVTIWVIHAGDPDLSVNAESVLTFTTGNWSTEQTVTIDADQDNDDVNGTATFTHTATSTDTTYAGLSIASVTAREADDEALKVVFGASSYTAVENGTAATVTVTLDQASDQALNIPLTTTPASGDFTVSAASLSFAAGDQTKTVTVTATNDDDLDDETVDLGFGDLTGMSVTPGTQATTTVTLEDDDRAALSVSFGADAYTATEGGTAATVTVRLSAASDRALTIPLTTTPASGDFTLSAASLSFAKDEQTKTVTVTATDDTLAEVNETVVLGFGTLPADVTAGTPATTRVTLVDDDRAALTVSFGAAAYTATEGGTAATVTVTLSADSDRALTIPLTTTPASGDFTLSAASLSFAVGDRTKTVTVTATDDTLAEVDETVVLGFGPLPADVTESTPATTTVTLVDNDRTALSVSFGADAYTATEGGTAATVTVTLSADSDRPLTIPLTTTSASGDFKLSADSLSFAVGDRTRTVTVTATDDDDLDDETVELGFGDLTGLGVTPGTQATTTVTLEDNDRAALSVSFEADAYTATEGGTAATVTVTLSAASDRALTIPLTTTPASGDFTLSAASLSFAADEQSQTVTVTATDDADLDNETVELGFGTLPVDVTAGTPATATVTLVDDDQTGLTVSFAASAYSTTEGAATGVTVTVSLNKASTQLLTIPLTTTPASGDFTVSAASLSFAAGEQSQTITVTATNDADLDDETVDLGFGPLPQDVTAGTIATATVTLVDNDRTALSVSFGADAYTATEGGAAVTVTVQLSAASDRALTLPLTTTPASGDDFTLSAASLSFAKGDRTKTVTVTATNDDDLDDEIVQLDFGLLPADVTEGTPSTTTVTLVDDDRTALTVSFGADAYTATEGGTAATVTVTLSADSDRALTIPLTIMPETGDFTVSATEVVFAVGDRTKTVTVTVIDDTLVEVNEMVVLGFGTLPADVTAGTPATTTVTLEDDDRAALSVSFGADAYTATEGGAAATVTVTLDQASDRALTIPLTTTPTSGDFTLSAASLSFAKGDRTKTVTVTATNDTLAEVNETVVLGFGTLPVDVAEGTPATTRVTLEDDDRTGLSVSFGADAYTATEGGTAATVTVRLSAASDRALTIPLTTTPASGDFTLSAASLSFAKGDRTKTVTVTATDDTLAEVNETVQLGFGDLTGMGLTLGTPATTTVTLVDDDRAALTVSFGAAAYTATEGGTAATVTVTLSAASDRALTIPLTTTPASGDFTLSAASLSFAVGDRTKTITVTATDDTLAEVDETVVLGFGPLPADVTEGTPATTTVTLVDNDRTALTVSFGADAYTATEGGTAATVTVTLSADSDRPLTIPLTTTSADGDFRLSADSLSFAVGDRTKTVTVTATDDDDLDDETVELGFGDLTGLGVTPGTQATTTVTLEDNDRAALSVSFEADAYTATEGGTAATVTVTLSAASDRALTIPLTTTPASGDFTLSTDSLSFAVGEQSQTVTVTAADDADLDNETVELGFGTLPVDVTAGTPATATVTLVDDDQTGLTVSFAASAYSTIEGAATGVTVTVSLNKASTQLLTIPLTTTPASGDFTVSAASLSFAAGEQSQTITVTATNDADLDDETVELGFGPLPQDVTAGPIATATVTLVDNDRTALSVSFGADAYTATEGGAAVTVTVQLSAASDRALTIPLTTTPASGDDFTLSAASLSFAKGDRTKTVTVTATNDDDLDDEIVQLDFGLLPADVTEGTPSTTTVTLVDDDRTALTVSFGADAYTATEGGTAATVTVTLDQVSDRALTIPLEVTGGTAGAEDYGVTVASPHTWNPITQTVDLSFGVGKQSQTFTVEASDDTLAEVNETVVLGFGTLPVDVAEGTPATTTVTLVDDDRVALSVSFGADAYTATEGGAAAMVTVTLDQASDRALTIPLTTTPASGDFTLSAASLSFAVGDRTRTVTVTATDDTLVEVNETVQLGFGDLTGMGVTPGTQATTTVTLVDNDRTGLSVSFGADAYTATEGGTAATVTVTLSAAATQARTIPLTTTPASGDFTLSAASLSFAVGEQSQTVTVTATDDADLEDETVEMGFGTLPANVTAGPIATATVTLVDDDQTGLSVSFGADAYTATEGGMAATVTVTLSAASDRALTLPLTTTPASGDFTLSAASLSFAVGEQSQTVTVTATDDADLEDETVDLGFGTLPADVTAGTPATATVTLVDDDQTGLKVSFAASAYSTGEGAAPGVTVTVNLNKAPDEARTIPLTTTPASGDFTLSAASLSFAVGEQSQTVTVTATDDADLEDETVELGFGTLPADVTAGPIATATVTLVDDDRAALSVSFGADAYTATEGGTAATVTVRLSAVSDRALTIPLTTTPASGDFTVSVTEVVFAKGEQSQTVTVTATDDADLEDETVRLGFGTLPADVTAGTPATATVTLVDDDQTGLKVSFAASAYSTGEGAALGVTVTVSLNKAPDEARTIPLTTTPASGDFTVSAASLSFAVGEQSRTVTVTATNDDDLDDETVELGFGTLPADVTAGPIATATVTLVDDDRAALSVSFGADAYTATEGGTVATVTVTLSAASDRALTIPLTTTPASGDFTLSAASLSFAVGEQSRTVTVTATDDADLEDETVRLGFGTLPADVTAGTVARTTVTLVDDDRAALSVSFGADAYTATEGGAAATVTVTLSAASDRALTIPLTTTPAAGGDFTLSAASLSFAKGEQSRTVTVTATDDTLAEVNETVQLGFGTLPADVTAGTPATATVTLVDDDRAALSVSFGADAYTATEGGTAATVTVTLSAASDRALTLPLTTTPASGDFTLSAASLSFAKGEQSRTVTVTATDDADLEDETVDLGFGTLPADVTAGTPATATVTLVDDDQTGLKVSFAASAYSTIEGAVPGVTVTVSLNKAPDEARTLPLTTTPASGDFTLSAASLSFAVGEQSRTVTVTATNDADLEDETVELGFGTLPADVTAGPIATATVTLVDDDRAALSVSFGADAYTATEGGTAATVTVTLSAASDRALTLPLTTTPASGDFTLSAASLSFAVGEQSRTVTVTATDDADLEDETVRLGFGTLPADVTAGTPATATVTLVDDDQTGLKVSFAASAYSTGEGAAPGVTVTVSLNKAPDEARTIPLTTTPASGDFTVSAASLSFAVGEQSRTVTVTATNDDDLEDETVELGFGTLPADVTAGPIATATVTLVDDDRAALSVSFGADAYTATEGGTAATVTVTLSAASDRALTLPLTTTPASGDFTVSVTEVVFAVGEQSRTVTVTATDDADLDDETVRLGFGTLPADVTAGPPATATVTLVDDDQTALSVSFGADAYTATEGGTAATVTVTLSAAATQARTLPLTTTPASGDFTLSAASLSFAVGEQSRTVTVTATDDADLEDETVRLGFGTLPADVTAGTPATATVTLVDDDQTGLKVSFAASAYSTGEGAAPGVTVTVSLNKAPDEARTIPLTTTPASGDFTVSAASLSFAVGEQSRTVTVTATNDDDLEDETVELGFGTLPADVTAGPIATATVTLVDDDRAALSVSFGADAYTATEGGTAATVTVTLSAASDRALTLPLTTTPASGDFTVSAASLSFAVGEQSRTVTVTATDDADLEDETVRLGFGTLPADVTAGPIARTTVTLVDDDQTGLKVSFAASAYSTGEGAALGVTVTVSLNKAPDEARTIPLTTTPASGDFTVSAASLSFAVGEQSRTVTVTATNDDDLEDETVELGFGTLPADVTAGPIATATVTLVDDDRAALSVSFGADAYTATEGGTAATVTVTLSAASDRALTIPLTTTPASGDFTLSAASLSFAKGEQSRTVTVTATDDADLEDETVRLGFGTLPADVTAGPVARTTVTLVDDDRAALSVSFGADAYTATEGGAAATVTVTLSAASDRALTLPLTTTPASGDFTVSVTEVVFAKGEQSRTVTVTATDDADLEDETVRLGFGTLPADVTAGTPATATVTLVDDDQTGLKVSFAASAYSTIEGAAPGVTVTVSLSAAATQVLTIPLTTTPASGDFTLSAASLNFAVGDRTKTVTVTATDDDDLEDETVELGFGTLPAEVTAGTVARTTVTLVDDDRTALSVSFGADAYTATEGGTAATVTVTLSAASDRALTLPLTTTPASGDFTLSAASLSFAKGEQSRTVTVTATDDADLEDETVRLGFGTLPADVTAGTPATATVTLVDDDQTGLKVSFAASAYSTGEGAVPGVTVTVSLNKAPDEARTIPLTTTPASGDFTLSAASLSFAVGEQSRTVTVTATDDADLEDETVELGFGTLPADVTAGPIATATVTLVDDDRAALSVSFGADAYTATEGGTAATVTVTLSAASDRALTIPLTTTPASGDFTLSAASLSFAVGEQSRTVTVTATDDADLEDETVRLGFGTLPADVTAGTVARTTVTLVDDDRAALSVSFGADAYTATEGGAAATVTVTLSAASDRALTIPLTTTPASGDFTVSVTEVVFAKGEQSRTVTVTATDDADLEDETVDLGFGTLPADVTAGTPATATVTLVDDDQTGLKVSFAASAYSTIEGAALGVTVTVSLNKAPDEARTIPLTTTPASGDFTVSVTEVVFAKGEQSRTVTVTATNDDDLEDETVELGFGTLPADVTAGPIATATVTLVDDDRAALSVSFGADAYTATEGGTAATVTVTLSAASDRALTIPLTTTPASGDFTLSAASLSFAVGEQSQTVTVTATDDADLEDETVRLGFGTLPADVTAGTVARTTVTLVDDDQTGLKVSFAASAYSTGEGAALGVTVTVSLNKAPDEARTIPLTTTPASGDFTVSAASLSFAVGEQSRTVTVTATNDDDLEDETVELGFGTLPADVTAGPIATATVTLVDDDRAALSVSFGADAYTATEGGAAVTVTVRLSAASDRALTLPLTTTPAAGDFTVSAIEVVFAMGDRTQTVTVTATDDADLEDETVRLGFGTLPADVTAGTVARATVILVDDDRVVPMVAFGADAYTATEGQADEMTVMVTLDPAPADQMLTIPVTVTGSTAEPTDYGVTVATPHTWNQTTQIVELSFGVGQQNQTFAVLAMDDADPDDETMTLGFGDLTGRGVTPGEPATATLTIADDDGAAVRARFRRLNDEILSKHALTLADVTVAAVTSRQDAGACASQANTASLGGQSSLAEILRASAQTLNTGSFNLKQLLGNSSFRLRLTEEDSGAGPRCLTLWGQGDYRNLSSGASQALNWDGDLVTGQVGADTLLRPDLLAGLAVSWSDGAFDYTDRTTGEPFSGDYRSRMLSVHPYVTWWSPMGLDLWATGGYGRGEIEIADEEAAGTHSSDTTLWLGSVGASGPLPIGDALIAGGTTTLRVKAQASLAQMDVEGNGSLLAAQTIAAQRLRLALEGSHERSLASGGSLTPSLEVGLRHDGGDGATGTGLELGGGLRYVDPALGLTIEGRGRVLAAYDEAYKEWGASGLIRVDPGRDGLGLSLSLAPSYGQTASGVQRLWDQGLTQGPTQGLSAMQAPTGRLEAEVGYGLAAFAGQGLVTPYSAVMLGRGTQQYRMGSRLELGPGLRLSLEGTRQVTTVGQADHGIRLQTDWRF